MQTLAEQIGERMQQALIETTDKIKDSLVESLESILGPNIEKLVENANLGSEAALNKLVERFMGAMSSEGETPKRANECGLCRRSERPG